MRNNLELEDFQRKGKKKVESSKIILVVIAIIVFLLMVFGMALAWFRSDSSILRIITTGVVSNAGVGIGFYYWKARTENSIKLKSIYKKDFVQIEESKNQYYNTPSYMENNYGNDFGRDISNGV